MPWGVAVAGIAGAVASDRAADKAADATKDASKDATALSKYQFEQGLKEVAPFKELGLNALPALSAAANQPVDQFNYRDPNQFLRDYFESSEYGTLNRQATDQILRNRSATGGLRSGGANVDLGNIAPTLGINALNRVNQQDLNRFGVNQGAKTDQFNRLYSIGSLGANVASGNQVAGANFASQAGANAINAGNAQALAYQQQGQAISGLATDLGSLYMANRMGYFDKQNQGKI
jgi:hypothetical protein